MKLNGIMLYYQLSQYFDIEYAHCTQEIYANRPIFYNRFFRMNGHVVVLYANDVVQCVDNVKGCILVCLNKPDCEIRSSENDIIILNDPISNSLTFNILMHIFDEFEEWDNHLNESVYKNTGFLELLESTNRVLLEPIALMDSNFKYVAYTSNSQVNQQFVDEINQLPLTDVNALVAMPGFKDLEKRPKAFHYVAGESVVYKNIFQNGTYVGRLSVITEETLEIEYCKAIFNHLAIYIERLYAQCYGFEITSQRLADLHQILRESLEGSAIESRHFQSLLKANHNAPQDVYCMVRFVSHVPGSHVHNMDYLCSQMERMWPGAYCISYKNEIAMLLNQTLFQRECNLDFLKELAYFLRESVLLAGISRSFTDISLICSSYRQTDFALKLGVEKHPTFWYHDFNTCALDYLLKYGCEGFLPEQVCSRQLLTLRDYDMNNGTFYYKTLYTYIKLQYNAVASAKELYIHRSSFINRMERIREIITLNLEDFNERAYLLLSYYILEMS